MTEDEYVPKVRIKFTCPHCGLEQHRYLPIKSYSDTHLTTCDHESGGCEKLVAIHLVPRFDVFTYILTEKNWEN